VHAQLNLADSAVDLINLGQARSLKVRMLVEGLDGTTLSDHTTQIEAASDARTQVGRLDLDRLAAGHTVFVELAVSNSDGQLLGTNVYWWSKDESALRELNALAPALISASASVANASDERTMTVHLKNTGTVPALLLKLTLKDAVTGTRILPAYYSENYLSLLPGEENTITVKFAAGTNQPTLALRGWNLTSEAVAMH
jgi:hypothetical protein